MTTIWIDAQLPPTLANWLTNTFGLEAVALREVGLRDARDIEIFEAARAANAVILTKDSDILWLTCGNVTNRNLRQLLSITLPDGLEKLRHGEMIVEISNSL